MSDDEFPSNETDFTVDTPVNEYDWTLPVDPTFTPEELRERLEMPTHTEITPAAIEGDPEIVTEYGAAIEPGAPLRWATTPLEDVDVIVEPSRADLAPYTRPFS